MQDTHEAWEHPVKKALSFVLYSLGGGLVAIATIAALASVTYSEGRRHTGAALTYFEQDGQADGGESWLPADTRPKPAARSTGAQDECQLPPNRFGEPFIRCS